MSQQQFSLELLELLLLKIKERRKNHYEEVNFSLDVSEDILAKGLTELLTNTARMTLLIVWSIELPRSNTFFLN